MGTSFRTPYTMLFALKVFLAFSLPCLTLANHPPLAQYKSGESYLRVDAAGKNLFSYINGKWVNINPRRMYRCFINEALVMGGYKRIGPVPLKQQIALKIHRRGSKHAKKKR